MHLGDGDEIVDGDELVGGRHVVRARPEDEGGHATRSEVAGVGGGEGHGELRRIARGRRGVGARHADERIVGRGVAGGEHGQHVLESHLV